MPPEKHRNKVPFIVGGVAVAVIVVAVIVFNVYQNYRHDQLVEAFTPVVTQAISDQYDGQDTIEGLASNDYIEPSPYSVSNISITSIAENGDSVSGDATATFANNNFSSDATVQYTLQQTGDNQYGNPQLTLTDVSTTPLAGISSDPEHGIDASDVTGYESGDTSCTATVVSSTGDSWVMVSGTETKYDYEFDGTAWTFDGERKGSETSAFGDLEGTYTNSGGDVSITISDLDKETGDSNVVLTTTTSFRAGGKTVKSFTAKATWTAQTDASRTKIKLLDYGDYGIDTAAGSYLSSSGDFEIDNPDDIPASVDVTDALFHFDIRFDPDNEGTIVLAPDDSYPAILDYDVNGKGYMSYNASGGVADLEDGNMTLTRAS